MKDEINNQEKWWVPALRLFAQMSAWVAGPIVIAIFFGRWLDEKFDKSPWLFLICVGVAFVITNVAIVKQGKSAIKEIDDSEKQSKKSIKK